MPPGTVVRISNAQHVQNASRLSVLELRLRGGAGAPGQMPGQGHPSSLGIEKGRCQVSEPSQDLILRP